MITATYGFARSADRSLLSRLWLVSVRVDIIQVRLDTLLFLLYSDLMNNQIPLPQSEISYLASLSASDVGAFHARLLALWEAGWSLSVLGNSVSPKRPRATIHYWVRKTASRTQTVPIPTPEFSKPLTSALLGVVSAKTRTIAPSVTPEVAAQLRDLSLQARRYRSRTSESNKFAVANREFTALVKDLRAQGIPAVDIADAAGISYRAVARRAAK